MRMRLDGSGGYSVILHDDAGAFIAIVHCGRQDSPLQAIRYALAAAAAGRGFVKGPTAVEQSKSATVMLYDDVLAFDDGEFVRFIRNGDAWRRRKG